MIHPNIGQLILYIVYQAEEIGGYTTTLRLVKFLYLIDLEYFRRYRELLTGLDWIYYTHGPYAFALPEIGNKLGYNLDREEFITGGHQGMLLHVQTPQDELNNFGSSIKNIVLNILRIWSDHDTSVLLDYIYCRTEPMKFAKKGEKLDFSTVQSGTNYFELHIPLNTKKVKTLKDSINSYSKEDFDDFTSLSTIHYEEICEEFSKLEDSFDPSFLIGIPHQKNNTQSLDLLPSDN